MQKKSLMKVLNKNDPSIEFYWNPAIISPHVLKILLK